MGDNRSKSYADGRMQMESYYGPRPTSKPRDFRSYSVNSYPSSYAPPPQQTQMVSVKDLKLKKAKSTSGSSSNFNWGLNDPEFQRKRRVASYKVYSVEGKVKGSFRKSFRWIKNRYTQVVYGWW
ncbi:uncharacterized protein LOC130764979 [Actinidia eriantha]|uniref:uncharacterized protein LOC130764979 n=1 Tax=Actinidia eriantha TaxID=165200 RepID=UPI002583D090|nr:uncharacterized protein LOC130764979 [Actinidia eriantha]